MNLRPLGDRVLVRRIEEKTQTDSGLLIPEMARETPLEGHAIAVGIGARDDAGKLIAPEVAVGDRVMFGKWAGSEVEVGGEKLLILKADDIMGIVEGAP